MMASSSWLITPASGGGHTAIIDDQSAAQVVGCAGVACSALAATPPGHRACPLALNRAQFVRVTASSDGCAEIIATRDTLFVQNKTGLAGRRRLPVSSVTARARPLNG